MFLKSSGTKAGVKDNISVAKVFTKAHGGGDSDLPELPKK